MKKLTKLQIFLLIVIGYLALCVVVALFTPNFWMSFLAGIFFGNMVVGIVDLVRFNKRMRVMNEKMKQREAEIDLKYNHFDNPIN